MTKKKTYKGDYLILSLKWSDGKDHLIWWCTDDAGYTSCIDKAGRYTAEQVAAKSHYYDNNDSTRAVMLYDVMEGLIGPINRIVSMSYRRPRKTYDCHVCQTSFSISPEFSPMLCRRCKTPTCGICYDEERCSHGAEIDIDQYGRPTSKKTGA